MANFFKDYHKERLEQAKEIQQQEDRREHTKITSDDILEYLEAILFDSGENTPFEDCEIQTYEQAEILTKDDGLVVELESGETIYLTVQCYSAKGKSMD